MSDRPPPGGLHRLLQEVEPGSRLVSMRRLRGGLDARMHVLRIEGPDGTRRNLVLRRYRPWDTRESTGEGMTREFQVLSLLNKTSVPVPKPLLLDAAGHFLGVPTMVLSYVEGRSRYQPRDAAGWCAEMASAAYAIHSVKPAAYDLTGLPVYDPERSRSSIARRREQFADSEPLVRDLASEIVGTLEAALPRIEWLPPSLIHEDFWPGNTVWRGGKLRAVIDWASACVGDPRVDVAQCRADVVISHSLELADEFLAAYEALSGPLPQLWFFDLRRGLLALRHYKSWVRGYRDAGLTFLSAEAAEPRLHAFLHRALEQAWADS